MREAVRPDGLTGYFGAASFDISARASCTVVMNCAGKKMVEAETPDHVAHGGLADLVDRVVDILDRDDGSLGIGDVIVGDRRDVDRDVVLGDDLLRGNLHRDGAQGYAHHLLDRNENQGQPRSPHALEFSKKKHHAALVLPQHPDRGESIDDDRDQDNETDTHQRLHLLASTVRDAIENARPTDTPDRLPPIEA